MTMPNLVNGRPVVDVDDPDTWPAPLARLIHQHAAAAQLEPDDLDLYVDLELDDQEDVVLGLLDGHLVRARHWTRLLDHDAEAIRSQGLRLLDVDLIHERLDRAHERGLFTDAEHATLRAEHVLTGGGERYGRRADQICLTLSAEAAPHDLSGVRYLLTFWGGEGIYWRHCEGEPALAQKLRSLGRPALVTAALDFSTSDLHRVYKSLAHTFVGKALGHAPANADIFYRKPIPPEHIESVVFPGDAAYDRLVGLPAA